MDKNKTGLIIKEARTRKSYTQSDLGDLIGVTNKAVSRWENGDSFPDIGVLERLSEVLEIKIQDIVTGEIHIDNETAIKETIRLAVVQKHRTKKNMICLTLKIFALICCIITGYLEFFLSSNYYNSKSGTVDITLMTITLFLVVVCSVYSHEENSNIDARISNIFGKISIATFGLEVTVIWGVTLLITNKNLFKMEQQISISSFIQPMLFLFFIINMMIFIFETSRGIKDNRNIHLSYVTSASALYMSALFINILHQFTSINTLYQLMFVRAVVVFVEGVAGLFILKKINRKKDRVFTGL